MDSTHRFGEHSLFAYGITDGLLDEMTEEQQSSIISIIESWLSEEEDANSNCLPDMWVLSIVSDSNVANLSFYVQR